MKGRLKQTLDRRQQQAVGLSKYIWQTEGDDRVRPEHAENDGQMFSREYPPTAEQAGLSPKCPLDSPVRMAYYLK